MEHVTPSAAVGKLGAAIIETRGVSSAASANAAIDHMRDWALGTNGKWVYGYPSDGYGINRHHVRFPVTCEGGEYTVVDGLAIDLQERIAKPWKSCGASERALPIC
jgi:malate dehydrogenase